MKFSNLNTGQKVVITIVLAISVLLLVPGLTRTLLFLCRPGVGCETSPDNFTPLSAVLIAYLAAELVVIAIGIALIMWMGNRSQRVNLHAKSQHGKRKVPIVYIGLIILVLVGGLLFVVWYRYSRTIQPSLPTNITKQSSAGCFYPYVDNDTCWPCFNNPNYIENDFYPVLSYILSKAQSTADKSLSKATLQLTVDYTLDCVNIEYDKENRILADAEGVFSYNNGTIYVLPNYNPLEDLLSSSVLLLHETTHAVQAASNPQLSCVDAEVGAYLHQFLFLGSLTDREQQYVMTRLVSNLYGYDQSPIMTTLNLIFGEIIQYKKTTGFSEDYNVRLKQMQDIVRNYVVTNPAYRRQCRLD